MNQALTSSDEIALFLRIVELGSFAAVAEETGQTPSAVSKAMSRLEDKLGVRLLQRTTRKLTITPEGETFLTHGRPILMAIEAMDAEVTTARGAPRGLIRVNTGTAFAKYRLAPSMAAFHERYPEIRIDLTVEDRRVDPVANQVDVTIRTGPTDDSRLYARHIGESRRVIVASAEYVRKHGAPERPEDLADHNCLVLGGLSRLSEWPMHVDGRIVPMHVTGSVTCDSAEVMLDMVRAGLGITRLQNFLMEADLASGALVALLETCHETEPVPLSALTPPGRENLPRVRAFLDFLVETWR